MKKDPSIDTVLARKLGWLQAGVWIIFYVFLLFYNMQKWEHPEYGVWASGIATASYLIAVYANASWLIPRYFRQQKAIYILLAILTIALLVGARMYAENKVLFPIHGKFYTYNLSHFSFAFITVFLAFAFGALLRIGIDYVLLLRQQEAMKSRQLAAELNLLKSQVQPHFLFNTLNNIYYLAYTKNERTAEVVAKLSDIMRYFVDEAPKEKVTLATEIKFLENYMELEQIRMRYPIALKMVIKADPLISIPPMLLIPLVENIFKHGIDKTKENSFVEIKLEQLNGELQLTTINALLNSSEARKGGMGLDNLKKRLQLLFGNRYELVTSSVNDHFNTRLKFPI